MSDLPSVVFPCDHMLVKLHNATESTDEPIIHDAYGFDKTYKELWGDITKTRDAIRASLPSTSLNEQGLLKEGHLYVSVMTASGYEFAVSFFAIRAIGGACMPFDPDTSPDEVKGFMSAAESRILLASQFLTEKVNEIAEHIRKDGDGAVSVLPISTDASSPEFNFELSKDLPVDQMKPGLVIFTSGTTGPPKGAVLPKCWLSIPARIEPDSASISHRPPFWIGGAASILSPLMNGIAVYMMKETNNARGIWELLKNKKITHMGFNPGLLRQMKDIYTDELANLPDEERQQYLNGFRNIAKMSSSGMMLSLKLEEFWMTLSGRSFEILYGSTETGLLALRTNGQSSKKLKYSIGVPWPGVQIKLSEGDHGEILIKHVMIFMHYLGNEAATKAAFDAEGYVKTGDRAHIVDGEYIYDGRMTDDSVQCGDLRISTIQVEEALSELPYVSQAMVVAVPNAKTGQSCGALIRLQKDVKPDDAPTLDRIKADLSQTLPDGMHPQVLRIVKEGEEIPYTVSLKPIKREILRRFFF